MTRSELIENLVSRMGHLSHPAVEEAVKQIFDGMIDALSHGRRIEIRGFGSFSLRYRAARLARNPKTGAKVQTQSKYSAHFKPGKELRDRVDEARQNGVALKDQDAD